MDKEVGREYKHWLKASKENEIAAESSSPPAAHAHCIVSFGSGWESFVRV